MIIAFSLVVAEEDDEMIFSNEVSEQCEEGLKLFAEYFRNLWD